MYISGIRTDAGFYEQNTKPRKTQKTEDVVIAEPVTEAEETVVRTADRRSESTVWRRMFGYGSPGIDVARELSRIKKDSVLVQYQFFVGMKGEHVKEDDKKEHFYL